MKKFNMVLTCAGGLLGGVLSHYVWPPVVQAQPQNPKEIRAQRFVLEDADGKVLGTFSARGASGSIRLFDDRGREIWSNPFNGILPATK